MEQTQDKTRTYWLYTLVFLVIEIALLVFLPAWFWLALPFLLTYTVLAFGAM